MTGKAEAWSLRYVAGYPDRHEHSGPGGEPIRIRAEGEWDLRKLSDDELDLLYRVQQKAARDDG